MRKKKSAPAAAKIPRKPRTVTPVPPAAMDLELLNVSQAAQLLGVQPGFLYAETRKRAQSQIPYCFLGRYLRFSRAALLKWLERRQEGGAA